jgi:hypothetical protein
MDYLALNNESKKAVLLRHIEQAEAEHYSIEVTIELANSLSANGTDEGAKAEYAAQAEIASKRLQEVTAQLQVYRVMYDALSE